MLFVVRVVVDFLRKSVSMNNLSQYEQPHHQPQAHQDGEASNNSSNKIQSKDDVAAGYASTDDAVPSSRATHECEWKRGPILIDHRSLYFGKAIKFPSPTSATSPRTSGSPIVTHTLSRFAFFSLSKMIFFELFGLGESNDGKFKSNYEIKRKLKVWLYDLVEFQ